MKGKKIEILIYFLIFLFSCIYFTKVCATNENQNLEISYRTHVQDVGWQNYVQNGEMSGTSGQSKRLEGINIKILNNTSNLSIKYQVHIQDIGWQDWKTDDELAGTTGQAKRLEAIRIKLENTNNYSIKYRVHIQNIGWQDWKTDGELAGTTGQALRLEAIQIKVVEKNTIGKLCIDTPSDGSTYYNNEITKLCVSGWKMSNVSDSYIKAYVDDKEIDSSLISYVERPDILNSINGYGTNIENPKPGYKFDIDRSILSSGKHTIKIELYVNNTKLAEESKNFNIDTNLHIQYQAHVQNIGWQDWNKDEGISGTTGQAYRIEALKIKLLNVPEGVHIKYRAHVQDIGWQEWKTDGEEAGTTGQEKRIEAIQIKLEGMEGYIVEYKSHVQNVGWQQWASNEMISGTVNQSLRVEAMQLRIVKAENTVVPKVKYIGHVSGIGWENYVKNGETSGSITGNNLEAIKIQLENVVNGASIKYQAHVQNIGWMNSVSNNEQTGVTGQSNAIEAIKIKLEGLKGYSIEYRVYINGTGWQDWVRDGNIAGTTGENKQIGAIQIKLNIDAYPHNGSDYANINTAKYPGYKELLDKLQSSHPAWTIKLLYTGLNFSSAVYGEYSIHNANLVPASSGSEWICPVCGTKSYDTGWYGASDKAIAYYMDPRNFLNDSNVFQFLDANKYESSSVSLAGIQINVNGTFLQNYACDIDTACRNKGVNPYYIISRLIQENGKSGSTTSKGMDGGDGNTYYNPFNIGASGNSTSEVIANALAKAKYYGWNNMEKALEGGIDFLKTNWLDNYQNTLYQNRFDIDSTNGTSLYSHQYMQNLSAAYSEGNLLRGYYINAGKVDSNLTFIIPVYEGMSSTLSPRPSDSVNSEEYPMNVIVNTESSSLALRSEASTSSTVIARYDKGTILLSVRRGINSTWQHVVTKDGKVGYMSGEYLKQINDEIKCNYSAYVKTEKSGGLNVRTGPSTTAGFSKVDYLPDYTPVTVIDDSTYKGYEGSDWVQWSRIILSDGRQAFVPSSYVKTN